MQIFQNAYTDDTLQHATEPLGNLVLIEPLWSKLSLGTTGWPHGWHSTTPATTSSSGSGLSSTCANNPVRRCASWYHMCALAIAFISWIIC